MPKRPRTHEHFDYSSLEKELQLAYQKAEKTTHKDSEEALLEYLSMVQSQSQPKKEKRRKMTSSIQVRLTRQRWEREAAQQALLAGKTPAGDFSIDQLPCQVTPPEPQIPKSERQLLMEDPNMRYVIVKNTDLAHDRDCPNVSVIPDSDFSMVSGVPLKRRFCPKCYHRALIRSCLAEDQMERLDVYCEAFSRMGASDEALRKLITDCGAVLYDAGQDRVFLRHADERWLLVAQPEDCQLHRIVYYEDKETGRLYSRLKQDWNGNLDKLAFRIAQYPLTKRRNAAIAIQRGLEELKNVRPLRRVSLLYQYYVYADRMRYHKNLGRICAVPFKILKIREYPDTNYTTVVCRIRKRDKQAFLETLEKMKGIDTDASDYIRFCRDRLPGNDEQRLRSVLRNNYNQNE